MELIMAIVTFVSTLTPFQAVLTIAVSILFVSQGWITFQGFKFKKESKRDTSRCLHGRAGSCELLRIQMEMAETYVAKISSEALEHYLLMRGQIVGEDIVLAMD